MSSPTGSTPSAASATCPVTSPPTPTSRAATLRYLANLRGTVEWAVVESIAKRLDLDLDGRMGALSHGNRQKVGIV